MKVLVIGGSGQLGSALMSCLKNFDVYGTYSKNKKKGLIRLDITNEKNVEDVLDKIKPDFVINTAALTHVDKCEDERELAYKINVLGNNYLFKKCLKIGSRLVFISTYYVFDGKKSWYSETDIPNPLNVYAETKLEAEEDTLESPFNLVVRASKIYSWGLDKRNFLARLITSLRNGKKFETTNDQYNNPISAEDLAFCIKRLIEEKAAGIYHAGGPDYVNNYEFACISADVFGLNKSLIIGKTTDNFNAAALRPKKCALKTGKIIKKTGFKPKSIKENLEKWKRMT